MKKSLFFRDFRPRIIPGPDPDPILREKNRIRDPGHNVTLWSYMNISIEYIMVLILDDNSKICVHCAVKKKYLLFNLCKTFD